MAGPREKTPLTISRSPTEPLVGQAPAAGANPPSRVDTLPDGFADLLQRNRLSLGDVIGGHYRVLELLGEGAMGTVFVAENVSIGLRVALKVVKPDLLANLEFRQRFQKEAEAIAAIHHPNVVRFLDLVVGDPTFLVMEFVPGESLTRILRREKRLAIERALAIALRLCWALDCAHAAGVVHRDLKPANIILTPDRESGETPKLIDFGLAKIAAVSEGKQLTRAGQLIGTPHYMPPEQISGQAVDARTDVYALGCVLFEMIAGQPPFPLESEDIELLYRQMYEPAPALSSVVAVPPAIDVVLARALAKQPERRFASMREMAAALAAVASPLAPAIGIDRAPRWRRLAMALCTLLVIGSAVVAWRWPRGAAARGEGRQLLLVSSRPVGATVEVDGKRLDETTPTAVRGLAPGRHLVRLSRAGASPVEQSVQVAADARLSLDVALPPASHAVELQTVPPEAQAYLDGRMLVGTTPLHLRITDDEFHELRVEKLGYEPMARRITPDDHDAVITLLLQAEQRPRGTLTVDANRALEVWLDGGPTGFVTPTIPFLVTVGDHVVEVRDQAGARAGTRRVHVARGESVHLMLDLPMAGGERRSP